MASCVLSNAQGKFSAMPMTSPVDFISGPRMVSAPGNRPKGMTASLTLKWSRRRSSLGKCRSAILSPAIMRAAAWAKGTPVAFEANGTVRLARGLASIM